MSNVSEKTKAKRLAIAQERSRRNSGGFRKASPSKLRRLASRATARAAGEVREAPVSPLDGRVRRAQGDGVKRAQAAQQAHEANQKKLYPNVKTRAELEAEKLSLVSAVKSAQKAATVAELRTIARDKGLKGYSKLGKADLIKLIEAK